MEAFNQLFTTTLGKVITGFVALLTFGIVCFILRSKNRLTVQAIAYSATAMAIAIILSQVKIFSLPQGGSITLCSMLFISLIGYWFGPTVGVLSGLSYGFLQLALGGYVVHPIQLLLDYLLGFGALGLSGLCRNSKSGLQNGLVLGATGRLLFTFISGYIFFAEYAWDGYTPALYSLVYNISYIGIETFISLMLLSVPNVVAAIDHVKGNISKTPASA